MTPRKTPSTKTATILLTFLALSLAGHPAWSSGDNTRQATMKLTAEAVIPPGGGTVTLPDNEVVVVVHEGAFNEPTKVRVEKVTPEDSPGPITEGVTVIKGVKIAFPDHSYNKSCDTYQGSVTAIVYFKAEGFVESPSRDGNYYTAVCAWDDIEGRKVAGVSRDWECMYGTGGNIYELNGGLYYAEYAFMFKGCSQYIYLVQYPRQLARKNCEAIGGKFSDPHQVVPVCSFDRESPYWMEESMGMWIKSLHK